MFVINYGKFKGVFKPYVNTLASSRNTGILAPKQPDRMWLCAGIYLIR